MAPETAQLLPRLAHGRHPACLLPCPPPWTPLPSSSAHGLLPQGARQVAGLGAWCGHPGGNPAPPSYRWQPQGPCPAPPPHSPTPPARLPQRLAPYSLRAQTWMPALSSQLSTAPMFLAVRPPGPPSPSARSPHAPNPSPCLASARCPCSPLPHPVCLSASRRTCGPQLPFPHHGPDSARCPLLPAQPSSLWEPLPPPATPSAPCH